MSTDSNSKATVDDVCAWHDAKKDRGELAANTARLRNTALRMLMTPLAEDEPRDVEWMRNHLDELGKRWATLNPQYQSDTTITYTSRARAALDDYMTWRKDPTTFRFKDRAPRQARPKAQQAAAPVPATNEVREAKWEPVHRDVVENTLRIGPNREFRFSMPLDVSIAEIRRIAAHLSTYASDWDSSSAIVRAER